MGRMALKGIPRKSPFFSFSPNRGDDRDKGSGVPRIYVIFYTSLIIFIVLLLGKLLRLPVALMIATGGSMKPTYEIGDMLLGVAPYIKGYGPGDVVVWCQDRWGTGCVAHRVVELDHDSLTTKGDANMLSDLPVSRSLVYYVVLSSIPRVAWIPAAFIIAMAYTVGTVRLMGDFARKGARGYTALSILACYIAFNSLMVSLSFIDGSFLRYDIPGVGLVARGLDLAESEYVLVYDFGPYEVEGYRCVMEGGVRAPTRFFNGTLEVMIPSEYFELLWNRSGYVRFLPSPPASVYSSFQINCTIELDKGMLVGRYLATFKWREPLLEANGSLVAVENPNPVPLNLTAMIFDRIGRRVVSTHNMEVRPLSVHVLDVAGAAEHAGEYDVRIVYLFLGRRRAQRVTVIVGG